MFFEAWCTGDTWLFVAGSVQVLIGPWIRTAHKIHMRKNCKTHPPRAWNKAKRGAGMKIAWVIDSASGINSEFAGKHNVYVIPLQVILNGQSYADMVDITEEEVYHRLDEGMMPTSSQPALGTFIALYQKLQSEGYDMVISIHISGSLSGTVNTAQLAAETVDIPVEIIDSGLVAKPMLFILEEGLRLYESTRSTLGDILSSMRSVRHRVVGYFILHDLRHLHRGGRLSASSALVGYLLQIKPVLRFEHQVFDVIAKLRTTRKAQEFLYQLLEKDVSQTGVQEISVVHANHFAEAENWMHQLRQKFSGIPVHISSLGTAVGVHSGSKAIGLAWLKQADSVQD